MSRPKRAFTLVELLVVIAIIGLLATLSVIALNSARAKARDTKRVADIRQISTALEMFFNDAGRYPKDAEWASGSLSYNGQTYLTTIPSAPSPADGSCDDTNNPFTYAQTEAGASYTLSFCLGSNTGNLAPGIIQNNPGGMISLGVPNNGGGVTCLNTNSGLESVEYGIDGDWKFRGMSTQDMSEYPTTAPIQSTDAYDGTYAIEFQGSGSYLSLATYSSVSTGNGSSYTTRLYAKGGGNLMVLYRDDDNDSWWNYTLNQWDTGVNPFGADYSTIITPTSSYGEFIIPNVIGTGGQTNLVLISLSDDVLVDNIIFRKNDTGSNLIGNNSFEDWVGFPSGWDYFKGNSDGIIEVEDDPTYIYAGSHSMKIGYGASTVNNVWINYNFAAINNNFDVKFFARSDDSSSVKGAEVRVVTADKSYYYNPNTNSWQAGFAASYFSLDNNFTEYSIENIPPSPSGDAEVQFLPVWNAPNSFLWLDNVCISAH